MAAHLARDDSGRRFGLLVLLTAVLFLAACSGTVKPKRYVQYPVKPGETLASISRRVGMSPADLLALNGLEGADEISEGRYLTIPFVDEPAVDNIVKTIFSKPYRGKGQGDVSGVRQVSLGNVRKYVGSLVPPLEEARISSPFGWRSQRFHEGVDLAAPEGTRIRAAHRGRVVLESSSFGRYGKTIVIQGDRFVSVYAHNSKNRVDLGDDVDAGEWIADVGQTGDASGPHLHFETRVKDDFDRYSAVDPLTFIRN